MAALTADKATPNVVNFDAVQGGWVLDMPVAASDIIYRGSFVEVDTLGGVQPADVDAGTVAGFGGIALEKADNSSGSLSDINCKVLVGAVIQYAVTGAIVASVGDVVYCSDDQTLTTTSTTNTACGWIIGHVTGTTCIIKLAFPGQNID